LNDVIAVVLFEELWLGIAVAGGVDHGFLLFFRA